MGANTGARFDSTSQSTAPDSGATTRIRARKSATETASEMPWVDDQKLMKSVIRKCKKEDLGLMKSMKSR